MRTSYREHYCKLNDSMVELFNIKNKLISPYHPQANGAAESMVKLFKQCLKHNISDLRTDYS